MAITSTRYKANSHEVQETTVKYEGRVVEIRKYIEHRNVSDTLDYSDYQDVKVTDALVYLGRHGKASWLDKEDRDLAVNERFQWVDCTNTFVWRGAEALHPTVDAWPLGVGLTDANFLEDYEAWKAHNAEVARVAAEKARAQAEAQRKFLEEEARNRPAKGKKMEVFKGRKVPIGTKGTVAFINEERGSVLLKDDDKWQDRNAPGIWVYITNVRAR